MVDVSCEVCTEALIQIIDKLDEGIHFIDKNGKTLIYNKSMSRLEHMEKKEIINKSFYEIAKNMKMKNSTLIEVLNNKKLIKDNIQKYLNKDGKEITTVNSTIPLKADGEFIGVLEISKDMTQIQTLTDQLLKVKEFEELNINSIEKKGYEFDDILGESNCILEVINLSKKAAKSDAPVFLYGETGTGKELISQSIHYCSKRKTGPFIAQNCAALPEGLLEGILFGTAKGGFTGAVDRPGLFEQANKGTLLLDEINSMPLQLQAKLLRVLQEKIVRRVGGTKDISIDVRIIATTNETPTNMIKENKLRKDLYYRLNVIYIHIPPLRDREKDVILLSNKFIDKYNKKLGKNVVGLTKKAINLLLSNYWQGNVRELENVIYSSMSIMDNEEILSSKMININTYDIDENIELLPIDIHSKPLDWIVADLEEKYIYEALTKSGDNITKAAAILGLSRQNIQYKMKKYNIRLTK